MHTQHTPPFRLARSSLGTEDYLGRQRAQCCEPVVSKQPERQRRTHLADLDMHIHCSVIGTCLSTSELRKLVPRFTALDREHATDLQIHHAAVELAVMGGAGAKALHKALDTRYALAIKRFGSVKDVEGVQQLWAEALKTGDVPPAYWAVMTHPAATLEMRQVAFGDVHMLSHLVGAANRADIRRLVALEEENAALKEKVERQQNRLHEMGKQRDALTRDLTTQIEQLTIRAERYRCTGDADLKAEVSTLRAALSELEQRVAVQTNRREAAEQRAEQEHVTAKTLRAALDEARTLLKAMRAESSAIEQAMEFSADGPAIQRNALDALQGKRIVYVGGRPSSNAVITRVVQSAGGQLTIHDGGIEDRKGLLPGVLPHADAVVFPVDCIDHDSMNTLKRVCDRHHIAYYPVRSASVASFIELMTRVYATQSASTA
jgi:hypothetical protein